MSRRAEPVAEFLAQARAGSARAVARLLSLAEDGLVDPADFGDPAGRAHVVGLTGAPGIGKSTATNALVGELRRTGRRVAVLAVDPSSPVTGGALLGDRVRMADHALDPGVFIRSMASRGHLGGLAASTAQAIRVLDAAGFEVILLETVGVGQSEVEVAGLADTTVVLLAPGMGDGIQAAKAGILEIGDVYVVNKADCDGAATLRRELRSMLALAVPFEDPVDGAAGGAWRPPVLLTVAATGKGIAKLASAIDEHGRHVVGHSR